mgnify:CR=1 FL=1
MNVLGEVVKIPRKVTEGGGGCFYCSRGIIALENLTLSVEKIFLQIENFSP